MFPQLARFTDLSLLLLRLMVAAIFVPSGWSDVRDPNKRAKSIGTSSSHVRTGASTFSGNDWGAGNAAAPSDSRFSAFTHTKNLSPRSIFDIVILDQRSLFILTCRQRCA